MTTEDAASGSLAGHAAQLAARARETALCLDFDGTLSPIVDDPEAARPLAGVVELLGPLAARFAAVALVADRPADYLAEHASRRACAIWGCTGLQERHCCVRRKQGGETAVSVRLAWAAVDGGGSGPDCRVTQRLPAALVGLHANGPRRSWVGPVGVT